MLILKRKILRFADDTQLSIYTRLGNSHATYLKGVQTLLPLYFLLCARVWNGKQPCKGSYLISVLDQLTVYVKHMYLSETLSNICRCIILLFSNVVFCNTFSGSEKAQLQRNSHNHQVPVSSMLAFYIMHSIINNHHQTKSLFINVLCLRPELGGSLTERLVHANVISTHLSTSWAHASG